MQSPSNYDKLFTVVQRVAPTSPIYSGDLFVQPLGDHAVRVHWTDTDYQARVFDLSVGEIERCDGQEDAVAMILDKMRPGHVVTISRDAGDTREEEPQYPKLLHQGSIDPAIFSEKKNVYQLPTSKQQKADGRRRLGQAARCRQIVDEIQGE